MPRRRNRFSQLEKQFRESGGQAAPGSKLAGYIDFKKGINHVTVSHKLTAAERKRYAFAILPFGRNIHDLAVAADRYQAPITAYSNTGRTALALSDAQCGYDNVTATTNRGGHFYPAVIRPAILRTDIAAGTPNSGITKKDYKRTYTKSYGIPFGRTISGVRDTVTGAAAASVGAVTEEEVKIALTEAINGAAGVTVKSISYLPEEFKSPEKELISPP